MPLCGQPQSSLAMTDISPRLGRARHLPDAFFRAARENAGRPAQWRRLDNQYEPISYDQLSSRIRHLASGLLQEGVKPGDRLAILMENRPEWAAIDYAVLSIGAVVVPLYCSYRPQDIAYVLNDAGVTAVFTSSGKLLEELGKGLRDCPKVRLRYAIETDALDEQWISLDELASSEIKAAALEKRLADIDRDTLATLVYTSGTTANPKGVMLTHGNILANLEAVPAVIDRFTSDEIMLSFLPLAHSLERTCGHFLVYSYGLSVAFAERPDTVAKNLAEARPSIMISVPRLLEVVRSRIQAQVAKQSWLRRWLFNTFLDLARRKERGALANQLHRLLDRLVGEKIRQRFGGRLRMMISGGAPLSREVGEFFEACGLPVVEGYGLTESSPMISGNPFADRRFGTVGKVLPGVEVIIAEDGEILARGANIMAGYWKQKQATREAIIDGWLHTGDIGHLDADGYLHITDRKKDIIVNSGGENIAPQRVEQLLTADEMIDQALVYGDRKPYLVALIVPNPEACQAWAAEKGLPETDWQHLCTSEILKKHLQTRINQLLKSLNPFEQVRRIYLLSEPFTIDSGLMTPTMKLKRRRICENHSDILESLYS